MSAIASVNFGSARRGSQDINLARRGSASIGMGANPRGTLTRGNSRGNLPVIPPGKLLVAKGDSRGSLKRGDSRSNLNTPPRRESVISKTSSAGKRFSLARSSSSSIDMLSKMIEASAIHENPLYVKPSSSPFYVKPNGGLKMRRVTSATVS